MKWLVYRGYYFEDVDHSHKQIRDMGLDPDDGAGNETARRFWFYLSFSLRFVSLTSLVCPTTFVFIKQLVLCAFLKVKTRLISNISIAEFCSAR